MKINRLISIALAALALALVGSQLVAQKSHLQDTQDNNFKIKVKDDRVIARDKSKPVRRALEEQYAKIAEAQRNEDIEALRATRTPDFTVDLPQGQKSPKGTNLIAGGSATGKGQPNDVPTLKGSNSISRLQREDKSCWCVIRGRCPTAIKSHAFGVMLRRVDTEAIQTETWVNTKDGWRLRHIGNVKPGASGPR
jgi:hypothetical protein